MLLRSPSSCPRDRYAKPSLLCTCVAVPVECVDVKILSLRQVDKQMRGKPAVAPKGEHSFMSPPRGAVLLLVITMWRSGFTGHPKNKQGALPRGMWAFVWRLVCGVRPPPTAAYPRGEGRQNRRNELRVQKLHSLLARLVLAFV